MLSGMARVNSSIWYSQYERNMQSGLIGKLFMFSHKFMEKRYKGSDYFETVLELGATNFKHVQYVKHKFGKYILTDIKSFEPLQLVEEYRTKGLPLFKNVYFEEADAQVLKRYKSNSIDRLIATCLILHLDSPKETLEEWRRVVRKSGGVLTFYVHCEPGALLRLGRFLSTNIKGKLKGQDHLAFVYLEHRNHFLAVKYAVREVFSNDEVKVSSFPFPGMTWNFNIWRIYHITLGKDSEGI
jgi:ubiquinone/menaquinone biosynthesis C-methylase UbiE